MHLFHIIKKKFICLRNYWIVSSQHSFLAGKNRKIKNKQYVSFIISKFLFLLCDKILYLPHDSEKYTYRFHLHRRKVKKDIVWKGLTLCIMNFELLPSEILIECFEYLNGSDIFHSFDQLNYRFDKLIQTLSLYFNFQDIRKSIFNQFCKKMLSNVEIQSQIYSLQISNKNTHGKIEEFRSLTFIASEVDAEFNYYLNFQCLT
jgi:hypothetical protein